MSAEILQKTRRIRIRRRPAGLAAEPPEKGLVIIIVALTATALIFFVSVVLNLGYSHVVRTELQVAADAAAVSAAMGLCASRECWREARGTALRTLEAHSLHGRVGEPTRIDLSGQEDLNAPVWDLGAARVTVERGRWWPATQSFESMEDPSETDWQAAHPGIPNFIGANAVRVVIERPRVGMFFNPFPGRGAPQYDVHGEAVAVGGRQGPVCVAPFAYPVCSLVNENGDFNANRACRFDKLIAEADRYCAPGEDCDVLPGAFWNPVPVDPTGFPDQGLGPWSYTKKGCPPFFWATDLSEYWHCPWQDDNSWEPTTVGYQLQSFMTGKSWSDTSEVEHEFRSLKQYWSQMPKFLARGSKFNIPRLVHVGDHYGVVGLPIAPGVPALDGADDEQKILNIISSSPPCVMAEIGQQFSILGQGLTLADADDVIWQQISGQLGSDDTSHPRLVDTDLGWPALTYKHRWNHPDWGEQPMRDPPPEPDGALSRAYAYDRANSYGACNSRRWGYRGMRGEAAPRAWTEVPAAADDYRFSYFRDTLQNDEGAYQSECYRPNDTMFGYYEDVFVSGDVDESGAPLEERGRVWRISIPVISESCEQSAVPPCQGINGAVEDPLVDASKPWQICAFISITIFDADIGHDPPVYPRGECASWEDDRWHYPWGFDLNAQSGGPDDALPAQCNNVRTRPVCDSRLLASVEHVGLPTPSLVR